MASIRFSEEYPCGNGSGVYTRLHSPHRYRWLPEGLNPALYCFSLAWHLGHFILRFYSVSDFGHSRSREGMVDSHQTQVQYEVPPARHTLTLTELNPKHDPG